VTSLTQYNSLRDKYSYDAIIAFSKEARFVSQIVEDQTINSKRLDWVHSLTHGVERYLHIKKFVDSKIKLTRAIGVASTSLSEFVLMGMLWHAKKLHHFMDN
jgi:phosphoglycerate dehydrogenase-like enzyme